MDRDAPVRLLTVQFFRRFFDNDLVSPNGDGHEHLSVLLAVVAVPGLLATVFLLLQYTSPLLSPGERMLTALPHKFLLFGCSLCVMALVTCIEWDALSLDARDRAILGPLPLSRRTIVASKLTALTVFAALFAAASNAIPAIGFPLVFLGTVPISLGRAVWVLCIHAVVSVLASLFGFVAILGIRESVRVLVGPRVFRVISAPLQFGGVLALGSALLILPAIPSAMTMDWLENRYQVARWMPPMWFVGLEETLTAGTILDAPGVDVPSAGRFWSADRDRRARAAYVANAPTFRRFAWTAMASLLGATAVALVAFMVGAWRRTGGEEAGVDRSNGAAPQPRLARLLARHPQRQAGLAFTLQTLSRSPEHRLHLAAYLAAGAATTLVLVGPSLAGPAAGRDAVPPRLYVAQMIIAFFVVAGLKAVFARPVALPANWMFQLCWTKDERRFRAGVRRAVALIIVAFLLLLVPLHAIWLDARVWVSHLVVGWMAAMVAAEVAVLRPGHLPFTCAGVPGGNLKKWWPGYVLAFISFTFGVGALERRAFLTTQGTAWLIATLAVLYAVTLGVRAVYARQGGPVTFEEQADLTQELGLGQA